MTEEEFLMSLPQSLDPDEKLKRLEQWRQENPQPEVEEEVIEVAVDFTLVVVDGEAAAVFFHE